MEGQELTTIIGGPVGVFDPEGQLEMAVRAAKALAKVIAQKKKPVIINGEQYLEFEDWLTLGQFDGVVVRTGDAEPVEINGVQGAKAKAYLHNKHTGELIGGAEAYCMRDEEKWGTRPKYEWQGEGNNRKRVKVGEEIVPWFQLASMAQTRGGSKALRKKEAWIAVLAGYKPTPAEEMTENNVSETVKERRTVDRSEHYCPIHDVNFFMKGRMKGYAHPIEGTEPVEWCHEPSAKPTAQAQEPPTEPPAEKKEAPEPKSSPQKQEDSGKPPIELDWLKEQQTILLNKGIGSWSNKGIVEKIRAITGKDSKSVREAVGYLDKKQAEEFVKEIQEAVDMA